MPATTDNYGFKKPLGTESVMIDVLNENFDDIDEILAPSVSDAAAPPSGSTGGLLATVLGWIANRIKAITGKSKWYETPSVNLETVKNHIGSRGVDQHNTATTSQSGFMSNSDKSKLDGATSAATASKIIIRDSSGRAKVVNPSNELDIANKGYVDTSLSAHGAIGRGAEHPVATSSVAGFMSIADKSKLDGATNVETINKIIMRDGSGRARVSSPSNNYDIANKLYVDNKFAAVQNNIVIGSYTGNGSSERTISLGFTPSAVIVMDLYGNTLDDVDGCSGGIALNGLNCVRRSASESYKTDWDYRYCTIGVVTNGFRVSYYSSNKVYTNYNGRTFYYIAFK